MRVLIVDDEAGIREIICTVLAMKGYETLEARNGLEALELARQCPCDLVITDQVMPGMKGLDLIARLSAERYPACYLLMSGYGFKNEDGGLPFLAKPFTVKELVEILEKVATLPTLPELELAWREARNDWKRVIAETEGVLRDVPSEIPHPDGALRIEQVSQKRRTAFEKYIEAFQQDKKAVRPGGASPPGKAKKEHHID